MARDTLRIKVNEEESLIIAADNSGNIGEKDLDEVKVTYDLVGYFSFRVAVMECIASGGIPHTVILQNFNGEEAWHSLIKGINKGIAEICINDMKITGSTESNFAILQSATSIVVIGRERHDLVREGKLSLTDDLALAVIGKPLVGKDVIEKAGELAPLSLFKWCSEQSFIKGIIPVGSKGILHELNVLLKNDNPLKETDVLTDYLNLRQSSGPSTCFIIAFPKEYEEEIATAAGNLFNSLHINVNR